MLGTDMLPTSPPRPALYTLHNETLGVATYKPSWAAQPWPYLFSKGDGAWACGGNNQWRLVVIEDDGTLELHDGRLVTVYTARWNKGGNVVRGAFAPLDGDLKPDTQDVRQLLEEDNVLLMSD